MITTKKPPQSETSALPEMLTADEVAQLLRIHPVTVRLKAASGEIPGRQIGNRWRFSKARIDEWMRETA